MKTDTQIRHVTYPGANMFLELGFSPAQAKRLRAELRTRIDEAKRLEEQLTADLVYRGETGRGTDH